MRCFRRIVLVTAVALIAGVTAACKDEPGPAAAAPAPPAVQVAKPLLKEIVEHDEFTGRFEAVDFVEIRARVSGFLSKVEFRDGSIVKEGDLLFVIDRRPYQAAVEQAEAVLASVEARIEFLRVDVDRYARLVQTNSAAERTLQERRQQYSEAQAEQRGAQAALTRARLDLEFTEIRAPLAGRISRKFVAEGNLVDANTTLLTTIVSTDPIHFYFDVDERSFLAYVRMAQEGTRVSGRDGYPVKLAVGDERVAQRDGFVNFVDNRVDQATGTMRGRATVPNKDLFLVPGLFGRIEIPGSGLYKAVMIPDEAIFADLDRRSVYVVAADGSVTPQPIRPGPRVDGYRIVRQGLTGEETIVVSGIQRVRLGGKVTPQPVTLAPTR